MRMFISFSRSLFLALVFILAALFLLTNAGRTYVVPTITYPFLWCSEVISRPIKHLYYTLRGISYFHQTAARLLQERDSLLRELVALKGAHDYLDDSRECQEFKKRYEDGASLAVQIIGTHFSDQAHYYYIDAGENRGIQKDMVVIYDNCLVGRVSEVFPHYSKVMLITDKECHVAVRCTETGSCGIHTGGNIIDQTVMEYVNHLDPLYEDDLVISHGEGLVFPRGFAVGRIASYTLDGVQYKVAIKPLIDLSQLTHCLVLLKY